MEVWKDVDKRKPGVVHVVVLIMLTALGATASSLGAFIQIGYGVSGFYLGVVVQVLGGIWFGFWGVLAGTFFPMIGDLVGGVPITVSLAFLPANLVQTLIPATYFRLFKVDPTLSSRKSWLHLLASGVILNNLVGALLGVSAELALEFITPDFYPIGVVGWFVGNVLPMLVVGIPLLKALSPIIVKHRAFCRGWLA